jgi:hypothetical protein
MEHRYILQPYKGRASRFACPECRHRRHTFTRYIDTRTGESLADNVGKCDRLDRCGYHYPPRAWFADNAPPFNANYHTMNHEPQPMNEFDTLPNHYVDAAARYFERNNFIAFLTKYFDYATAIRLTSPYKLGTSKHWPGATIFWQIDINNKVRTGKIMLYNPADGHRVKKPFNHITWVHTLIQKSKVISQNPGPEQGFNLNQCFFGEHLLNTGTDATVAIAESEKTAIVCKHYWPEYTWLASGSLEGLTLNKCKVLKNRKVILYPDLNGFDNWKAKARELNLRIPSATFKVDNTLERVASMADRELGLDMADRWLDQLVR